MVTVIFRNDSYGNVARGLDEGFNGTYGTDLHNPDLIKFAESFGAVGLRAEDPLELETLVPQALGARGAGAHRRALRRDADTKGAADFLRLQSALDAAPRGPYHVLSRE